MLHVVACAADVAIRDFADLLAARAIQLQDATLDGCQRKMFAMLRTMTPWTPPKSWRLCGPDGVQAPSYLAERKLIRANFEARLDGVTCSLADVVEQERYDAPLLAQQRIDVVADLSIVSTVADVCADLATSKVHKAIGEDLFGGEVFKLAPQAAAIALHPLIAKGMPTARPPLQGQGGYMHTLSKKGAPCVLANYRVIMLNSHTAGVSSAATRKALLPVINDFAQAGQNDSGLNGGSTAFAHLTVSCVFSSAEVKRKTS